MSFAAVLLCKMKVRNDGMICAVKTISKIKKSGYFVANAHISEWNTLDFYVLFMYTIIALVYTFPRM